MKRVYWALIGTFIFTINAYAVNVSSVWQNVTGNWGVAANWTNFPNTANFPNNGNGGNTYDATLGGGAATLNQTIIIQNFNFNGGTVGGSNNLTENAVFTWKGGTYSGTGTNFATGGLAVSGPVVLSQSTLVPAVSSTLTNGYLDIANAAVVSNATGLVIDILDDSSFLDTAGIATLVNLGTIEKTGAGNDVSDQGLSNSVIGSLFTNRNVVLANVGTLSITLGGYSSGTFTTAPTGCILFTANYTLDGGTLSGSGTVEINNGNGVIALTNTVTATVANFLQASGTIGGPGNLVIDGLYKWTGGTTSGTGTNFINGSLVVDGPVILSQRTLVPTVSSTLTNGYLNIANGAVFSNMPGLVINFQDDSSFLDTSGIGTLVNLGVIEKTGAGNDVSDQGISNSVIGSLFTNRNVVLANVGTISITFAGYSSGTFTTAPPGCILFTGNYTLDGGTLSGGGTVEVNNGNGVITLTNTVTATVSTFVQASGTIGGPGNLLIDGLFRWTGGTDSGIGTNFANGGLALGGTAVESQRKLVISASSTQTNGYLDIIGSAVVNNTVGAVFDILDDSSILDTSGFGTFINQGVLEKTGAGNNISGEGVSNSAVSVVFTNSGTVDAQTGIFNFEAGYVQTAGASEVNGGTLSCTTPFNILGGSVIGNGTILGTVVNNGTISPGLSSAGSLTIAGTLTNKAGATLFIELGGYTRGTGYDFLTVTNKAFLGGNLAVSFINNYSFISSVTNGASFIVATCGTNFAGSFANVASGGLLTTMDDFATFTVTYSGSNLVLSSLHILDSVGDGIPNWWRQEFFGSPNNMTNNISCASCDPDGDGMNNLDEYLAGTDPTDSGSALAITGITREGNNVLVTWNTAGGHTNMLQVGSGGAGGVFNTNTFIDLPPEIIVTGSGDATTNQLDVGGATNTPARYYRVRLVP
jgi:hypothetical protein